MFQVGLVEHHAKKLMLKDSIEKTELVEREIASIITAPTANFEGQILAQAKAAYRAEIDLIHGADAALKQGKLSERRFRQLVASIEASADNVVTPMSAPPALSSPRPRHASPRARPQRRLARAGRNWRDLRHAV